MAQNDEREKRNAVCRECDTRKAYAKMFDVHFDWRDCPYDCPNDFEHYCMEERGADDERTD